MTITNHEQLGDLLDQIHNQIDAFHTRASSAISGASHESFTGYSNDRRVKAVVSNDGRTVLDIELKAGFGDLNRPAWLLADDVDLTCRGIVEAINAAREGAAERSTTALAEEFPEAFELLKDLKE
ncbi:YbaB/EbfC family nucleoid-associated protein [Nocardia rosealba]|uniref:YbaB/EbfC family nucleoid-associated protein n=1 Tax=Nocardia rosealba TaxID=2878563 RepID=UPI001CD96239|nr:YbaB/EbfC family nucleoid-associated protein [Nocardia rosealba]MCA2209279.1 YbaB/EbfC family nucleoid-associated protein [Nocardia rosealba]